MSFALPSVSAQSIAPVVTASQGDAGASPTAFARVLEHANDLLKQADSMAAGFAQGKADLTDAVLAASHADVSFGFLIALRNRALTAYQDVMNMAV